jgi:microcystin-dependent protein
VGNGTTTFNLPDMRGVFMRGVDGAAGNDLNNSTRVATNGGNSGNNVGSWQDDAFETHTHTIPNLGSTTNVSSLLGGTPVYNSGSTTASNATGGSETRPKNVYVYYIIKL